MTITLSQQLTPYALLPFYGVEMWKDVAGKTFSDEAGTTVVAADQATYGGGSEFTQQNLLVGFWSGDGAGGFNAKLRPGYTFQTPLGVLAPNVPGNALQPLTPSRTTASVVIAPEDNGGPALTGTIIGIINPPEEYKDLLAGAIETPDDDWNNIEYNKGIYDFLYWRKPFFSPEGLVQPQTITSDVITPIALITAKQLFPAIPLQIMLKTNGSDGEKPTFWDTSTPQKLKAVLDAKNYYLMWNISWDYESIDPTDGYQFYLEWPHSLVR